MGPRFLQLRRDSLKPTAVLQARRRGAPVVIFDCNGVLVDSEQIAAAAAADEFARAGIPITPELVTRYFSGRRPADMLASGLIHSGDSQIARSSSSSGHESRNCRQRHPSGLPSA